MSEQPDDARPRGTPSLAAAAGVRAVLLTLVWAALTNGEGWAFGVPAVALCTGLSLKLAPPARQPLRLVALPGFIGWFAWQSLRAGWDVALRTLHPAIPLKPGFVTAAIHLPQGMPVWCLMLVVSLLPGTLSVSLQNEQLELHCLDVDQRVKEDIDRAQAAVTRLFGLDEISS